MLIAGIFDVIRNLANVDFFSENFALINPYHYYLNIPSLDIFMMQIIDECNA